MSQPKRSVETLGRVGQNIVHRRSVETLGISQHGDDKESLASPSPVPKNETNDQERGRK
jgi:hypothetical protein